MNMGRLGVIFGTVFTASLAGCAHVPSSPPAVSGFGPACNSCDRQPVLPRLRLAPTPAPPLGGPPPQGNPPGFVPDARYYSPADPMVKPAPEARRLPPDVRLSPPQIGEQQTPKAAGVLPVDIPQFAIARKEVASGQKPFPEGIDWLRSKGYRTVLFIRPPGEDDSAARRLFSAKGFRYLSLEVSPLTLNRDMLDEFNRIVTDAANLPLFVFDRDSSLLGGLWYLHFRIHEGYDSDRAAIEAGRLGLNIDADGGPHKDMWLAIQTFLKPMSKTSVKPGRDHTASWIKSQR